MKPLADWIDDREKAAWPRHRLILFSTATSSVSVYADRVFIYPLVSFQWGPTQWGLALTAVRTLAASLNALMVQSQNSPSFHWPLWNEHTLPEPACRASSVWGPTPVSKISTITMDTAGWEWGKLCEEPLFVTGDSLEGARFWSWQRRREKNWKENRTACWRPTKKGSKPG